MEPTNEPLLVVLLMTFALAANVVSAVFFRRMRKGRFDVLARTPAGTSFRTDLATFRIDTVHRSIALVSPSGRRSAPLGDVQAVRIRESEDAAWLLEFMRGFDLMDLAGRYRDTVLWSTVSLRFVDGSEWPVFVAGQYQPREFLMGWFLDLQARVLVRLGWITDVPVRVHAVADELAALLARGGVHVPIE